MDEQTLTLFLAGDTMISRPWSTVRDQAFQDLVAQMRAANFAIVNLETVIHEFEDHAQAHSGGDWMASPPVIAAELKWAGIDMVAHANNHAFDYGTGAVLATHRHAAAAGLMLAGSGADLQAARAPRYLQASGSSIALVSIASTFVSYGKASRSRADLLGRPGINPLALRHDTVLNTPPRLNYVLETFARLLRRGHSKRIFGISITPGPRIRLKHGPRPVGADARANLAAISEAAATSDIAVVSLHAHLHGRWLQKFARRALDAGAAVVIVHGPHEVRGIEIYRHRPIFYSLGDFVYEPDCVARFPQEMYDRYGLSDEAGPEELRAVLRRNKLANRREVYEGAAAILRYDHGHCVKLELLPLDLQFDAASESRGRPRLADPKLGRQIILRISERSAPFRTRVRYDAQSNRGIVDIGD